MLRCLLGLVRWLVRDLFGDRTGERVQDLALARLDLDHQALGDRVQARFQARARVLVPVLAQLDQEQGLLAPVQAQVQDRVLALAQVPVQFLEGAGQSAGLEASGLHGPQPPHRQVPGSTRLAAA